MHTAAFSGNPSNGKPQLLPPRRPLLPETGTGVPQPWQPFPGPTVSPLGVGTVWDARELVLQPTCKSLCRESFPRLGLWSPGLKQLAVPGTPVWRLGPNFHHRANHSLKSSNPSQTGKDVHATARSSQCERAGAAPASCPPRGCSPGSHPTPS